MASLKTSDGGGLEAVVMVPAHRSPVE
jgi:hypothetical protein